MNQLSLCKVNQTSPYEVSKVDTRTYEFVTDQGVRYLVGFLEDESIQSCKSYQFYISKITPIHTIEDVKIKQTVIAVIENFFESNESVLLYLCDTSDGRQEIRSRLFLRWFVMNNKDNRYLCKDTSIKVEGISIYAAIIVRMDNPLLNTIIAEFEETVNILSEGK